MPDPNIKSSTKNAKNVKQGHTASGRHGTDPNFKGKIPSTRDLNAPKAK